MFHVALPKPNARTTAAKVITNGTTRWRGIASNPVGWGAAAAACGALGGARLAFLRRGPWLLNKQPIVLLWKERSNKPRRPKAASATHGSTDQNTPRTAAARS